MAEDLGEKTEDPTQKRREESRERGQVARSADLSAAIILSGAAVVLFFFGDRALEGMGTLMRTALEPETLGRGVRASAVGEAIELAAGVGFRILAPILLLMAAIAYAEQLLQVGWNFTIKPITPKPDRLSPLRGLKQIFSRRSLVKGVINILKLVCIATVAFTVIHFAHERIVAIPVLTVGGIVLVIIRMMIELAFWVLAILILIGVIDRTYQTWQHTQDLRMSKQEVKDERKSTEGDPENKARRLRVSREIMRQRLRSAVPHADVVVTNPSHYAVAIKYDQDSMSAPKVVAKGADFLALQIRLIASASGVPIVERKPLARALYRSVEVGQEIPADLYEAVAEVLAYVYRLEGRLAAS